MLKFTSVGGVGKDSRNGVGAEFFFVHLPNEGDHRGDRVVPAELSYPDTDRV